MRVPRRVPWASLAELDQVCAWIYFDENDMDSKQLAINRISAWKFMTALPHAIETTLSLLSVIIEDNSSQGSSNRLSIRQSYAAAIIRMVNGLVDPLQLGMYARSIASIATQLGLPPWLVELRHAATHEELPSLEVLREAARESMSWLLHNYWIPAINPSTAPPPQGKPLRPISPLLKEYKTLLKLITRDASLKSQNKHDVHAILREIERWLGEAKVNANRLTAGDLWEPDDEDDPKEHAALEKLCDSLLEKGWLVPLSKKKRVFQTDSFLPPAFSIALWSPLLLHIQSLHPDFSSVMANRVVHHLTADSRVSSDFSGENELPELSDPSFDMCLARWAFWAIDTCPQDMDLRRDTAIVLFTALGPSSNSNTSGHHAAMALLCSICQDDPELEHALSMLMRSLDMNSKASWTKNDMAIMAQRLEQLVSSGDVISRSEAEPDESMAVEPTIRLPTGWKLVSGWKSGPIGVHTASIDT